MTAWFFHFLIVKIPRVFCRASRLLHGMQISYAASFWSLYSQCLATNLSSFFVNTGTELYHQYKAIMKTFVCFLWLIVFPTLFAASIRREQQSLKKTIRLLHALVSLSVCVYVLCCADNLQMNNIILIGELLLLILAKNIM